MSNSVFKTPSLGVAAFITSRSALPLLRIELDPLRDAGMFVFSDVHGLGASLETEFETGGLISAILFHQQLRALRRRVERELAAGRAR